MVQIMTQAIRWLGRRRRDERSHMARAQFPSDFSQLEIDIIRRVRPFTLTSDERICMLIRSVQYLVKHGIAVDIVECGVWRGGSMMAAALLLKHMGVSDRRLYLFDTYEGMPRPEEREQSVDGCDAQSYFREHQTGLDSSDWCCASLDEVKRNLWSTGYDPGKIHFVRGKVEHTVPHKDLERIALLRLDTDWYSSTKHELVHLYPLLSKGGVLIIDDYGYWSGSRKATDEYVEEHGVPLLLVRVDSSARLAVKI